MNHGARRQGEMTWAGLSLVGLLFGVGPVLRAAEVFTPEDVARVRWVSSAVISPDGERIAYVLGVPRQPFEGENGPAWGELHVVDADGHSRPFVTGEVNVSAVKWTLDGEGISFLAKRGEDEHKSLYVISVDGGEARNILAHETDITSYDWSPDGRQVAFLAREAKFDERLDLEEQGFDQEVFEEQLQFVRVWIATPEDDEAEPRMLELAGSASELHWSPAGARLAIALAPTPLVDDSYMRRKVHVVDVELGTVLARFDNPGKLGQVAWSPDGKHLAMISAEDRNDPSPGRLMVVSAVGGQLRDLLPGLEGHVTAVAWSNDETVMFLSDESVWTLLGQVDIDGSQRETHVPTGRAVLASLSLSRNGQAAAVLGESAQFPREVFRMQRGDDRPRRLTHSNPWLADVRLAKQEVIRHTARDGLELEGLLIRPLDEEPGQRYPLILSVHGGPESHVRNGWITRYAGPGQFAAAKGFAVFYPNYRGSTGRGVQFSKTSQADPAGKEFDDLVDAVDHLVKMGLVDRKRVGVTGGSYGGYATAWCSTALTEHFAAGVMFVGLTDLVSKVGTTDIPEEMYEVHYRKRVWDHWDFFRSRSPIYHAKKARTPLLILHGKADTRVHPGQSMELYRYLKTLGNVPVRLVWYPGEGHGNRKAAARYDYSLRMLRWFEHYLKGEGGTPPPPELDYALQPADDEEEE